MPVNDVESLTFKLGAVNWRIGGIQLFASLLSALTSTVTVVIRVFANAILAYLLGLVYRIYIHRFD